MCLEVTEVFLKAEITDRSSDRRTHTLLSLVSLCKWLTVRNTQNTASCILKQILYMFLVISVWKVYIFPLQLRWKCTFLTFYEETFKVTFLVRCVSADSRRAQTQLLTHCSGNTSLVCTQTLRDHPDLHISLLFFSGCMWSEEDRERQTFLQVCALTVDQVSSRQMLQHGASCRFYFCRSDVINIRFARLRLPRNKTIGQIQWALPLNPRLYCKPAAVRPAAALRL